MTRTQRALRDDWLTIAARCHEGIPYGLCREVCVVCGWDNIEDKAEMEAMLNAYGVPSEEQVYRHGAMTGFFDDQTGGGTVRPDEPRCLFACLMAALVESGDA